MAWVVLGHSFYSGTLIPWKNTFAVADVYSKWSILMVTDATLSVDTFFLLSGFLMSYLTLKEYDKKKYSSLFINPKGFPQFMFRTIYSYLHRYIRLTPAYALIMLVLSTLLLHMGSGPLWATKEDQADACAQQWWKNLLYINNFFDAKPSCMGESWYLAADFQLFLFGPWFMMLIWSFEKIQLMLSVGFMAVLLATSCAIPGILTAVNEWPPQMFTSTGLGLSGPDWFNGFYIQFYTRSTPYIWGIIFGYIMFKCQHIDRKKGTKLPMFMVAAGWIFSTTVCLTTVFGLAQYWPINLGCVGKRGDPECFTMAAAVTWAAFGRLAWAMGVSWVMFACITGYGGIINSFLSWALFAPLSKLTYCTYLIHIDVIFLFFYNTKRPMYFSEYTIVYEFFGHYVITTIFALLASLLFESPFIGLEKLAYQIIGNSMPKKPERSNPPNQQRPEVANVALSNEKTTDETETSPPPYSIENGIDNPAYNPEGKIAKENM